jgi:aryl-alcohol dehydrogenase-like predicted oxidoreductase
MTSPAPSRLALGTVQFGLDYGVTHGGGRVPEGEIRTILAVAHSAGIDTLDTAAGYGDAEDVLGSVAAGQSFRIITKTIASGAAAVSEPDMDRIEARFLQSLEKLATPSVDGVLVHAVGDLLTPAGDKLWQRMQHWRAQGLVRRIGVSVYDRVETNAVLTRFSPDLVQLPLSALDQRLLHDGTIQKLSDRGIAIHVRSVFLQGLLLQNPAECPARLSRTLPLLERWWSMCRDQHVSPLAAALRFGLGIESVERIVVGVHSAAHLREIIAATQASVPDLDWEALAAHDIEAVDPRRWPKIR